MRTEGLASSAGYARRRLERHSDGQPGRITTLALGEIVSLIELAIEGTKGVLSSAQKRRFKRLSAKLWTLYFTPSETRAMIDRVLQGKEITSYHVQELTRKLYESGPLVHQALMELAMAFDEAGLDILLRDVELRDKIESGKRSVRREIEEALRDPLIHNEQPDLERVARLKADIEAINAAIFELQANLKPQS